MTSQEISYEQVRATADWQLAQCLNYIRITYGNEAMIPFMEAMRPQGPQENIDTNY